MEMYKDTPALKELRMELFLLGFTYTISNTRSNPPIASLLHYEYTINRKRIVISIDTSVTSNTGSNTRFVCLHINDKFITTAHLNYKCIIEEVMEIINDKK